MVFGIFLALEVRGRVVVIDEEIAIVRIQRCECRSSFHAIGRVCRTVRFLGIFFG